jgi:serine/threonine protein kinase
VNATCPSCKISYDAAEGSTCSRCTRTAALTPTLDLDPRYTPTHIGTPVGPPSPGPLPEIRVPGYEVLASLGQGGMGFVLKARDLKLDRIVALKMPLAPLLAEPTFRERFLREARASAKLRHSNICPIYEVGEHQGVPFIAMAFIDGSTLRSWAPANRPPARQSAEILAVLSRAVAFAHRNGVIHRDLKPDNVLIETSTHQPMLMDFGLAKETRGEGGHVTQSGQVFGTPAYMPPEQAAGRTERMGAWSDVYSLGAILYELLTGRPPFTGTTGEVIHKVQHEEPLAPRKLVPTVHRDLETICLKALAKLPEDRYATAEALAADLEAFAAGEAIQARPPGLHDRLLRAVKRHPRTAAFAAASILLLAGGAAFSSRLLSSSRRIADLQRRLDTPAGGLLDEAGLASREALCGELASLDPAAGARARERLLKGAADAVRAALREARVDEQEERIRNSIQALRRRDAATAADLDVALEGRRALWEALFDLSPPFADLARVFEPGRITVSGEALGARGGEAGVPTRIPTESIMRVQARFRAGMSPKPFGLGLGGYRFLLYPSAGSGVPGRLEARRGKLLLREVALPVEAPELYELGVHREGPEFRVQLGNLALARVEDLFPLTASASSRVELILPVGVQATAFSASRRPLAARPSPLERADALYHEGRIEEAITGYSQQLIQAGSGPVALEARYKIGVCQIQAGRQEEALKGLTGLITEPGDRWPLLAICQIWLLHLRRGELDQAETFLGLFQARYDPKVLASALPDDLRHQIITAYGATSAGAVLLIVDPARIARLERATRVVEVLSPPGETNLWVHWNLVRACHLENDLAAAEKHARKAIDRARRPDGQLDGWGISLLEELSWLLRLQGRFDEALRLGEPYQTWSPMRIERARALAAKGDDAGAGRTLETLLKELPASRMEYRHWAAAWLLRGMLEERRGDAKAMEEAWARGRRDAWEEAAGEDRKSPTSGMDHHLTIVLAALSGGLKQEHLKTALDFLSQQKEEGPLSRPQDLLQMFVGLKPEALTRLFRTARGMAYCRDVAFLRIPLSGVIDGPAKIALQYIFASCPDRELGSEESEAAWTTAGRCVDFYRTGKLEKNIVTALGVAYVARLGLVSWPILAKALPPDLRGGVAYFLAFKHERKGRAEDARFLWNRAKDDAAEGSPLKRLASEQLDRLK